jgi:recombinational DNA repair ATPase RecF
MWIKQIQIRNFRSFGTTSQTMVAEPGLNVIVGENNVGKSSIFRAVELAVNQHARTPGDAPWGSTATDFVVADVVKNIVYEGRLHISLRHKVR